MKKWVSIVFVFAALAYADQARKVIYGEDDRLEYYQVDSSLQHLALSTAIQIPADSIGQTEDDPASLSITGRPLRSLGMCEDEPFADQLTAGNCSGFLVAEDLLVSAGHCMIYAASCEDYKWVFDFHISSELNSVLAEDEGLSMNVPKSSVYSCAKVEEIVLDEPETNDYVVIRLDRPVVDRDPLAFRTEGIVNDDANLIVIGHPMGLPTKIDNGGGHDNIILENDSEKPSFVAQLDTYGGNSGSAVFNSADNVVEGILVRGERDFVFDWEKSCYRSNVCSSGAQQTDCAGEVVSRITNVKLLVPGDDSAQEEETSPTE